MIYDAKHSVVTRPERDNFFALESDINQIYKNLNLTKLLNSIPSNLILINRFRQVLFCNDNMIGFLNRDNINLGVRPGELLGCAFSQDSPYGCGEGPRCKVCDAVQVINESMQTRNHVAREASFHLEDEGEEHILKILVSASPYSTGDLNLTLVSFEEIKE